MNKILSVETNEAHLLDLLGELTLEEKVKLLTGRDFWSTWPIEKIGLRSIRMSDGPSGVRGEVWDERDPSLNLPSAAALASSWDPEIARGYGRASAAEAIRKGVDVVLGPTINLHRSPLGGRHFESFSEDPLLTADLAVAYVQGVQETGVAATPKHYVANDSETDRFTVDVQVGARALHELYLLPFEKAVIEGKAWAIMSAYNSINGTTATENELLENPLTSRWGFDGTVISDWTAVRSLESAKVPQDIVMPGPIGPWGDALVQAVENGEIAEQLIDDKVLRILRLADRVGALDSEAPKTTIAGESGAAFARRAEAEGTVLVKNDQILPLDRTGVRRIAVIGDSAENARTQGGGSATVVPAYVVDPLSGIKTAFPDAEVTFARGCTVQDGPEMMCLHEMKNPVSADFGAHVRFFDDDGNEIYTEERLASTFTYFGGAAPVSRMRTFEFSTVYTPDEDVTGGLAVIGVGRSKVYVDGVLQGETNATAVGQDLGAALLDPPAQTVPLTIAAGQSVEVRVEFSRDAPEGALADSFAVSFGVVNEERSSEEMIAEACSAAQDADAVVVVVGTNSKVESEGFDRENLKLPGDQNALVEAVARVAPNAIVVVNSGSPVELPWISNVGAVLLTYFGGQEYGSALADVLTGDVEPGGRTPTTWAKEMADLPVWQVVPDAAGKLSYDEGINIGYRAWLKSKRKPAFPFGFGLGYTSWNLEDVRTTGSLAADDLTLEIDIENTGERYGKQVVQVYAEKPGSSVDRPVRWLVAHEVVRADARVRSAVRIPVPRRSVEYWAGTSSEGDWAFEPGEYTLKLGFDVMNLPIELCAQ